MKCYKPFNVREPIWQAAEALHDSELMDSCIHNETQTARQISWLFTRIKQASPQALAVRK